MRTVLIVALATAALSLAACGDKGPEVKVEPIDNPAVGTYTMDAEATWPAVKRVQMDKIYGTGRSLSPEDEDAEVAKAKALMDTMAAGLELNADGTFTATYRLGNTNGTETGTWGVVRRTVTISGKSIGKVVGKYRDGVLKIQMIPGHRVEVVLKQQ